LVYVTLRDLVDPASGTVDLLVPSEAPTGHPERAEPRPPASASSSASSTCGSASVSTCGSASASAELAPPTRAVLRRQRAAVSLLFVTLGLLAGSWLARTPDVKARIGLEDSRWGVLGTLGSIGALSAILLSGVLINRFGTRRLLLVAAPLLLVAAPGLATSHSVAHLVLAILFWGAVTSLLQAPMNSAGVRVEQAYGRPIMSSLHAGFSLGTLSGALLSAAAVTAGVSPGLQLAGIGAALGLVFLVVLRWLPPDAPRHPADQLPRPRKPGRRSSGFVFTLPIIVLAGIGFCSVIAESTSSQWAAIYVSEGLGAGAAAGALAYACFSGAMSIGRLSGDRVVHRLGRKRFLSLVPLVAVAGIVAAVAFGSVWAAFAGFVLVGVGLSAVTPTVYGTAGTLPGQDPAPAIATISLVTWPGFLAGPVIVGTLSGATSLRVALLVIGVAAAIVTLLAARLRTH
jgi:MFS family permease